MADNSKIQRLLDNLEELLSTRPKNEKLLKLAPQFMNLYWQFMKTVHYDLLLKESQGAALATASCIRVWELLHFYSGSLGPFHGLPRVFLVCLFTAMYPKNKDRRCLYQHLGCLGSLGFPRVLLSNRLPMFSEIIEYTGTASGLHEVYAEVVEYVHNSVSAEESILSSGSVNELRGKVKKLIENILPQCSFVENMTNVPAIVTSHVDEIIIPLNGKASTPLQSYEVLKQTIWKYLIFSHVYLHEERRLLGNYLTTSAWSQKKICFSDGSVVTYATLMGFIVHEAAVCASLMPSVTAATSDNTPLIHPRVLGVLIPKEPMAQESSQPQCDLGEAYVPVKIMRRSVSVACATAKSTRDFLEESIPQEIGFLGASTCSRDCDKLTQFCRNALLSPVSRDTAAGGNGGLSPTVMKRLLFNRKRKRDDAFYEGPAFLPILSSLSEMLDEQAKEKPLSTLERIATTSYST